MQHATLCLLVKENGDVLLGMKKKGFGAGKFNGFGGKVELGEDVTAATVRELWEESSVRVEKNDLIKHAVLKFLFPEAPKDKNWNQIVHVFVARKWDGVPVESDEMNPAWFSRKDIPFHNMWADDEHWLPHVLDGKQVEGTFVFDKEGKISGQELKVV